MERKAVRRSRKPWSYAAGNVSRCLKRNHIKKKTSKSDAYQIHLILRRSMTIFGASPQNRSFSAPISLGTPFQGPKIEFLWHKRDHVCAPVLFKTMGFGNDASLMSAVITGLVNVFATLVSIFTVDKYGRRFLFIEGGIQMAVSQIVMGILLAFKLGTTGVGEMSKGYAAAVVIVMCLFVAAFAWSWGPLGWLVPSEIFPLEIRSAGQSITVCTNLLFTFVVAQAFLAMLCHFKFGIFLFFSGWVIVMTVFVALFLPETKNVPIEEVGRIWREHWFWGKIVPPSVSGSHHHKHVSPAAVAADLP